MTPNYCNLAKENGALRDFLFFKKRFRHKYSHSVSQKVRETEEDF